jgi:arylsulfatase A-like enzyme
VIGFSGIFLSFLVALPFGIVIFGENATLVAALAVPFCLGLIGALLLVLWYPGIFQWLLESLPLPGKARLQGLVTRVSHAAAAYRDKKMLVLAAFGLSFVVHFTTAAMYYFTALAIGAVNAEFWPIAFGSSIQILATVLSPFTIAGEGIREAAQYALLGHMIGPANAIVSAALGFWAAEALTLAGAYFWWFRPKGYQPEYCLVDGVQVDYEVAARQATALESDEERAEREATAPAELLPLAQRMRMSASLGLGAGMFAGLVIGVAEAAVIALGGLGGDAQVFWFAPVTHALLLGALGLAGGAVLAILPMDEEDIRGWTPSLTLLGTLLPLGLFIAFFRLRRDVYLEQMPPASVLAALLGTAALLGLLLFFLGPRLFRGRLGGALRPASVLVALLGVAIAGGASAAWIVGSAGGPEPRSGIPPALADRPNVLLIMVDTLRADHLSCYGGPIPTPNLCSLAENGGARFRGFSHSSWTKPATATLLTSLLPSSHGVMSKPSSLSPDVEMISEVLRGNGYATGGIVSNINLASSFGFDQGYDEYHYLGPDYLFGAQESSSKLILYQLLRVVFFKLKPGLRVGDFYQSAETVNEVAFDFLERHEDSRFFLFLHYMDPHDPYFAHPYDGTGIARAANQHPDPSRAELMHELYLGEIEYLDARFGEFLAKLDELGLSDDTVIALVSDHGEEFYEHGGWWHGTTLYEEQIAVPFMVKWSHRGGLASADGEAVRMLDVAPTLIARTGARPPASMQGIDLVDHLGRRAERDRLVYAEEDHEGNVLRAIRSEDWKWIEANEGNPRGLPRAALFQLGEDAHERENVADSTPWVVDELREHADAQQRLARSRAVEGGGEATLSEQEVETLKALGYLQE